MLARISSLIERAHFVSYPRAAREENGSSLSATLVLLTLLPLSLAQMSLLR